MQDYKTMISMCAEQEEKFQFEHFSREDALKIGLKLHENAKEQPVAVEITVNGLVVFRCFGEGWRRVFGNFSLRGGNQGGGMTSFQALSTAIAAQVETSSLRFFAELEDAGETFADRKLDPNEYAAGGGFPIRLRGTGVIGSICVSGYPDHVDDHQLIINTLAEYFA